MASLKQLFDKAGLAGAVARGFLRVTCRPGVTVGSLPLLHGRLRFKTGGVLKIGNRLVADGRLTPVYLASGNSAQLVIGDDVYFNTGSSVICNHEITIGDHVMFGPHAAVIDDNRHEVEPGAALSNGPTVIEDNVWVGRNVLVLPGVRIGAGSVIGAQSVVSRDIPPRVFAAGSPAKVIRELQLPEGWVRR
jgi:acetyltransferase-like isoleucine patch superfamily enzyme